MGMVLLWAWSWIRSDLLSCLPTLRFCDLDTIQTIESWNELEGTQGWESPISYKNSGCCMPEDSDRSLARPFLKISCKGASVASLVACSFILMFLQLGSLFWDLIKRPLNKICWQISYDFTNISSPFTGLSCTFVPFFRKRIQFAFFSFLNVKC